MLGVRQSTLLRAKVECKQRPGGYCDGHRDDRIAAYRHLYCSPILRRYPFRPNNDATRGQVSKIVANAFFPGCQTP